jgi:hypothetical protein
MAGSRNDRNDVEIRLDGHLDAHWSTWLDGLTLTHESDGTTTLRGALADQAQLHGLLAKIRDMGAGLISLTPIEDDGVASWGLPCKPSRAPAPGRPQQP